MLCRLQLGQKKKLSMNFEQHTTLALTIKINISKSDQSNIISSKENSLPHLTDKSYIFTHIFKNHRILQLK